MVFSRFRLREMAVQAQDYTGISSLPLVQRWLKILSDLLTTNASIRGCSAMYFNSAFGLLGFILLLRSTVMSIKYRMPLELMPSMMAYVSIMIVAAFMSPLEWLRYFLFPIFGLMLLISYGVAFWVEKIRFSINIKSLQVSKKNLVDQT